jgi:L-aspartate oxidase
MSLLMTHKTDVLIIGSGLAGLALALKLSKNCSVVILTKDKAPDTNTAMAQGGIAAVMSNEDSFISHEADTINAGAGLCHPEVVKNIISQAPDRIKDLINWGVHFDLRKSENSEDIDLTKEGGHEHRRILHHEDSTGAEIHRALLAQVKASEKIRVVEQKFAIDLILNKQVDPLDMSPARCIGAYVFDKKSNQVETWLAKTTVLATGGAGKVYLYTSNWSGATGDGIAMAYRAGARIANLEFMQFHPTCLFHRDSRNVLISEALRGEGGVLVDRNGKPFMEKYHPLQSLAPRDIVARSIDAEMKASGDVCVFLDMSARSPDYLTSRFPSIHAKCLEYGIDMTKQPIPVVPAAHYLCGGILTDLHGKSDLAGLWAVGENACTGLHGANRLASNSLLEAISIPHNAAPQIIEAVQKTEPFDFDVRPWVSPVQTNADEMIVIHHMWDEIRRLMWNYVGIVRSDKRLLRAKARLQTIMSEVKENYSNLQVQNDILELRNIALVADLTVQCALARRESRGIHYNIDCISQDHSSSAQNTVVFRGMQ